MKIILVEDNVIIGFDICARLVHLNCEVIGPFATTEQALNCIRNTQLDGAILDYSIRGGNSKAIADALREVQCPFVFMTGHAALPEEFRHVARLEKPVRTEILAQFIDEFRLHRAAFPGRG